MRKMLFALAALAALALLTPDTGVAQGDANQIGIYTTQTPDFSNITDADTRVNGAGSHTAYVICSYPHNDNTDTDITSLGGFEFQLDWGSLFVTPTLHPSATNFMSAPDFYCGANVPVANGMAVLVTLSIGSFTEDPVDFFIMPVSDSAAQSIPGAIAITDFDDNYSISRAYPASGDFANPIFGFNTSVVPNEDATWSDVKNLYR